MVYLWFSVRFWELEKNPICRLKPPSVQETSEMPLWWFNLPDQTYSFLWKYPSELLLLNLGQREWHWNIHCCCSVAQSSLTLCDSMDCSMLGLPIPHYLPKFPKFMFIALVMPSSHLMLWYFLLLLPSIIPRIRDFCNESSVRIRRPKNWNFSFSINPSNEYSGLISLKIDWLDFLAVQGTLKGLLQHHSSKGHQFFGALPTLTTICDHWEDHSLEYMDLCWQSNVSAFQDTV